MTAAILILFAGYTIGSYGVVLLKGYDIPPAQWINPLNPWKWPAGGMQDHMVPAGQTFPGGAPAASPTDASGRLNINNLPDIRTLPRVSN